MTNGSGMRTKRSEWLISTAFSKGHAPLITHSSHAGRARSHSLLPKKKHLYRTVVHSTPGGQKCMSFCETQLSLEKNHPETWKTGILSNAHHITSIRQRNITEKDVEHYSTWHELCLIRLSLRLMRHADSAPSVCGSSMLWLSNFSPIKARYFTLFAWQSY